MEKNVSPLLWNSTDYNASLRYSYHQWHVKCDFSLSFQTDYKITPVQWSFFENHFRKWRNKNVRKRNIIPYGTTIVCKVVFSHMKEYASMKDQSIFIEAMSTIARHCASDYRTSSAVVMAVSSCATSAFSFSHQFRTIFATAIVSRVSGNDQKQFKRHLVTVKRCLNRKLLWFLTACVFCFMFEGIFAKNSMRIFAKKRSSRYNLKVIFHWITDNYASYSLELVRVGCWLRALVRVYTCQTTRKRSGFICFFFFSFSFSVRSTWSRNDEIYARYTWRWCTIARVTRELLRVMS